MRPSSIQQEDFLRDGSAQHRLDDLETGQPKEEKVDEDIEGRHHHLETHRNQFQTAMDMVADVAMFAVAMVFQVA
jgi:hypothetical protein